MSDEYGYSERRKNKNDKRAKAKFGRFKHGGRFRATNVNESGRREEEKGN